MTTPEQLDQFIDAMQDGQPMQPQTDEEALSHELINLAQHFELSATFDNDLIAQFTPPKSNHRTLPTPWLRLTASLVIGIVGITLLIATVPALRVIAEELVREFFPREAETVIMREDGLAFDSDAYLGYENIGEIQSQIDFRVNQPDLSDMDYSFDKVVYTIPRNTTTLYYSQPTPNQKPFWKLRIRQQPIVDSLNGMFNFMSEQDTISPEAETTPVSIAGYEGTLVQGDWFSSPPSKYYYWRGDTFVHRVRWQDETFLYEIHLWETDEDAIDQLLAIADIMMENKGN